MIVFINFGGQHGRWAGPAMLIATLLLNGGLSMILSFLDTLFNWSEWDAEEWQDTETSWVWDIVDLAILAVMGVVLYKLWRYLQQAVQQRRQGLWSGHMRRGLGHPHGAAQGPQQSAERRRQLFEEMAATLQKLPTEIVASKADLEQLSTRELKERLQHAGLEKEADACVEKHDLVELALGAGGSSSTSCSICCEEYEAGGEEVVRVLPCHHRFHVECIDRWFLSAMDYSREPACPLCNAPLLDRHRRSAAAQ